jgi:hypothetical protein
MYEGDPSTAGAALRAATSLPEPVAALHTAIDGLTAVDVTTLDDAGQAAVVQSLTAAQARLEAHRLATLAAFDRGMTWSHDGSLNAGAWLARHTPLDAPAARREVRIAKRLAATPRTAAALQAGELSTGAAALIADMAEADPVAFDAVEAAIVEAAKTNPRTRVRGALQIWQDHVRDDDPLGQTFDRQHANRGLHVSKTLGGMVVLDGRFDAIDGAELIELLQGYEQHLYRTDKDTAESAPPADQGLDHLGRTPTQRRADALMELLRAGADTYARGDNNHPRVAACATRVSLLLNAEDLLQDPDTPDSDSAAAVPAILGGDEITLNREIARYLTCDCFARTILTGPNDEPLQLGREYRTPTRAVRTALVGRDRGCVFPGCDRPPRWCDAHHIKHWTRGGHTNIENLGLLCRLHHRLIHANNGWTIRIDHDGLPTISHHGIDQPRDQRALHRLLPKPGAPPGAGP